MKHRIRLGLATCLLMTMVGSAEAQSFGRWDIPSTPCQFFGHGFSGGHHAPMVRMPGGRPVYVPRVAIVPPRERMADPGKYPHQAYRSYDCGTGYCSGGSHEYYAPQMQVYQQPMQPTLAPAAVQPTFAAPAAKRKPAKPQAEMKAKPKAKPQAKSVIKPRRQELLIEPIPKPKKMDPPPVPPMPTTDPLINQNDQQASFGF